MLNSSIFLSLPLEQQLDPPQKERLGAALVEMDRQLKKLTDTPWLCQPMEPGEEEVCGSCTWLQGLVAHAISPCVQCSP